MTRRVEPKPRQRVMTKDEWIAKHLRRAPVRDEEWVRRLHVLQGRAE
jgi:hypothetical protein